MPTLSRSMKLAGVLAVSGIALLGGTSAALAATNHPTSSVSTGGAVTTVDVPTAGDVKDAAKTGTSADVKDTPDVATAGDVKDPAETKDSVPDTGNIQQGDQSGPETKDATDATDAKDGDNVQQGDQTAPDTGAESARG